MRFSSTGVCEIPDEELAQKVIDSCDSLVNAELTEEEIDKLRAEVGVEAAKAIEATKFTPDDLGTFKASPEVAVQSTAKAESLKVIGSPAGESESGSFEAAPEAPIIKTAVVDETPIIKTAENTEGIVKAPEVPGHLTETLNEFDAKDIKEMLEVSDVDPKEYEGVSDKDTLVGLVVKHKLAE